MTETQQKPDQQQQQAPYDDQSHFDTTFLAQITQSGFGQTVDWAREYFDSIESQVRSARRVAEVSALAQIQQHIVAQVAQLVKRQIMSDLKNDPALKQHLSS